MSKKIKKILFVGGGTGGHIYPLIAVANSLKKKLPCQFLFLGTGSEVERKILNFESFHWKRVYSGKMRRDFSLYTLLFNIRDIFLIIIGFFQAIIILKKFKPDIIFSKGSYVSVPVCFAAKVLRLPFVIHESDVMPSLTTKLCSSKAKAIFTSFPIGIYPLWVRKKAIYTGLPLREDYEKKYKNLSEDYILIVGGSSGALTLNEKVFKILPELVKKHKVIHLIGDNEISADEVKSKLEKKYSENYSYFKYRSDTADLIKNAKLVISRSGATSIFEIARFNKKALLVPINQEVAPHQLLNAQILKDLSLAEILYEQESEKAFLKKINAQLEQKGSKISALYFPASSDYIAQLICDFLAFEKTLAIKKVFMIGIGGVSMKALAHLLEKLGKKVSGSDIKTGGHDFKNINFSYDLVVYSSAASSKSLARVEHRAAKKMKIKLLKRSQLIGEIMRGYRGVSISGMHGKTSTTSLMASVLEKGGLSPSYLVGAEYSQNSPSYKFGSGIDFVSEACEYDGSFLDFPTKIAIVTNIEKEHLDYFKGGMSDILLAFKEFISNIYPGGLLVYCEDDPQLRRLVEQNKKYLMLRKIKLISYGFSDQASAKITKYRVEDGLAKYKIDKLELETRKVGRFFALNSAAVFSVAKFLGVTDMDIQKAISEFSGASRRFELVGEKKGIIVYDDYGHHPTEIKVTLEALKEAYPNKRRFIIFQPHQQKRFNDFYRDFKEVFLKADVCAVGILPVYQVAGRDEQAVRSSEDLVKELKNENKYFYLDNYMSAEEFLRKNLRQGDVVMTMGATDVYKIGESFIKH